MNTSLYLYNFIKSTKVLGMGNRFAIWVQGCNKRCKDCIVPDSWSKISNGNTIYVDDLINKVLQVENIQGITISGGEPFLQSNSLIEFINKLNEQKENMDYIVYTGLNYQEILLNKIQKKLLNHIDLLIDGEYIDELNSGTPLVGSSNQGVYILSDNGHKLAQDMNKQSSRKIEFVVENGDNLFMVGIPPRGINKKIKKGIK